MAGVRTKSPHIKQAIHDIEIDRGHHLTGSFQPPTPLDARGGPPSMPRRRPPIGLDTFYDSKGFWNDIVSLRWMLVPSSSFKLLVGPVLLYFLAASFYFGPNPFEPMLFISHRIPESSPSDPRYAKGWLDFIFVAYHIIFFSFIRQFSLFYFIHPIARLLGVRKIAKVERFGEQGYAVLYYGTMGLWGCYIMSSLPTWWYNTQYYWIDYPHWGMQPMLKRYYLMHLSYWLQQLIILVLKIERPRKDYSELFAHHLVTLWLIGWSYALNLTLIGNAVFVSMDIPDVFLAVSKMANYLNYVKTKVVTFLVFFVVWTYFRHWLNLKLLWSVWTEFQLIPQEAKHFDPKNGVWMVWWMKYQIFVPMLLLKLLNVFWYYLMCRILYRAIMGSSVTDDRSDDEGDDC